MCKPERDEEIYVDHSTPQFPDDDAEMNLGIKGSISRTGPSYGIQDTRALHPRVTVRIKHKDRFICCMMKKIYQAYVHKDRSVILMAVRYRVAQQ